MNIAKLMKDLKSWKTTALGFLGGLMQKITPKQAKKNAIGVNYLILKGQKIVFNIRQSWLK